MFIFFAPHVGVDLNGKVGSLSRPNQEEISTACGAAVGAFKAVMKEREAAASNPYAIPETKSYGADDLIDSQVRAARAFVCVCHTSASLKAYTDP